MSNCFSKTNQAIADAWKERGPFPWKSVGAMLAWLSFSLGSILGSMFGGVYLAYWILGTVPDSRDPVANLIFISCLVVGVLVFIYGTILMDTCVWKTNLVSGSAKEKTE